MPGSFDRLPPLSRAEELQSYAASHFIGPLGWQAYYANYCVEVYNVSFEHLPETVQDEIASIGVISAEIIDRSKNIATLPRYITENFSKLPWQFFKFDFTQLFLNYGESEILEKVSNVDLEFFIQQTQLTPQNILTLNKLILYANLHEDRKKYLFAYFAERTPDFIAWTLACEAFSRDERDEKTLHIMLEQTPFLDVVEKVKVIFNFRNPLKFLNLPLLKIFFDFIEDDLSNRGSDYLKLMQLDMAIEDKIEIVCNYHEPMEELEIYEWRLGWLKSISIDTCSDEVKKIHQRILENLEKKITAKANYNTSLHQFIVPNNISTWDILINKLDCIDPYLLTFLIEKANVSCIEKWINDAKTTVEKRQRLTKVIQKSTDAAIKVWFSKIASKKSFFDLFIGPLATLDLSPLKIISQKKSLCRLVKEHHIMLYLDALSLRKRIYVQNYYKRELENFRDNAPFLSSIISIALLKAKHSSQSTYTPPTIHLGFGNACASLSDTSLSIQVRAAFLMTQASPIENFVQWMSVTEIPLEKWVEHYQCYLAMRYPELAVLEKKKETREDKKRRLELFGMEKELEEIKIFSKNIYIAINEKNYFDINRLLIESYNKISIWFFERSLIHLILEHGNEELCGKLGENQLNRFVDTEKADNKKIDSYKKILFSEIKESLKESILFYWSGNAIFSFEEILRLEEIKISIHSKNISHKKNIHRLILEDAYISFLVSLEDAVFNDSLLRLLLAVKTPINFYQWAICSPFISAERKQIFFQLCIEKLFCKEIDTFINFSFNNVLFNYWHANLVTAYFENVRSVALNNKFTASGMMFFSPALLDTELLGALRNRLYGNTLKSSDLTLVQQTSTGTKNLLAQLIQEACIDDRQELLRRIVANGDPELVRIWFHAVDTSFFSIFIYGDGEADLRALSLLKERPVLCEPTLLTATLLAILQKRALESPFEFFQKEICQVTAYWKNVSVLPLCAETSPRI